ncbi:MAG: serine hydrolase [Deltaproteobacteria bacterium]|nr:serine hydrolase [Deltaproteobacteria bacterium]
MSTCAIFQSAGVGCHLSRTNPYLVGFIVYLSLMFLVTSVSSSYATSPSSTSKISATTKKPQKKIHTKIKKKASIKPSRTRIIRPVSTVVQAKAVYCVNLANNETLIAKNQDERLPIASLTKLVTALVTLDHMALDKEIEIPSHIKTVPKSVVGLKPGDTLTVEDLLHGMLISSGNDCAEALACAFPGGKTKFIQALNKKAGSLGAKNTEFFTPSGLDRKPANASDDAKESEVQANMSTAREVADITRIAFSNKIIRSICQKKSHVLVSKLNSNGYPIRNTNKLLRDNLPVVGGKTGFTVRAGHCLASEFSPGKDLFVIVVLGSPDHFRDTRLLYLKALKHSNAPQNVSAEKPDRVAAK